MSPPVEPRLDQVSPVHTEATPCRRIVQQHGDRSSERCRIVPDQHIVAVSNGETFACLRCGHDRATGGEIRENLHARPASVREWSDAYRGIAEGFGEVRNPSRDGYIRRCEALRRIRSDQEETGVGNVWSQISHDHLRGLAIWHIVVVSHENNGTGFRAFRQNRNPTRVHAIRKDANPRSGFRALRENGLAIGLGGHERSGGASDCLDFEALGTPQESRHQPSPDRWSPPEPSTEEWGVRHLICKEIPVHVVLVEDEGHPPSVLVQSHEVQGLHYNEVRRVRRFAGRKIRPVVRTEPTQPGAHRVGHAKRSVFDSRHSRAIEPIGEDHADLRERGKHRDQSVHAGAESPVLGVGARRDDLDLHAPAPSGTADDPSMIASS